MGNESSAMALINLFCFLFLLLSNEATARGNRRTLKVYSQRHAIDFRVVLSQGDSSCISLNRHQRRRSRLQRMCPVGIDRLCLVQAFQALKTYVGVMVNAVTNVKIKNEKIEDTKQVTVKEKQREMLKKMI